MGTSFYVERGAQQDVGGGTWAAWGDVAATRFEGDAGGLALNGDVVTGHGGAGPAVEGGARRARVLEKQR